MFDCTEVDYVCDCPRERCEKVLLSLGEADYEEILKEAETEINCQFCEKKYVFTADELKTLRENAKKNYQSDENKALIWEQIERIIATADLTAN